MPLMDLSSIDDVLAAKTVSAYNKAIYQKLSEFFDVIAETYDELVTALQAENSATPIELSPASVKKKRAGTTLVSNVIRPRTQEHRSGKAALMGLVPSEGDPSILGAVPQLDGESVVP